MSVTPDTKNETSWSFRQSSIHNVFSLPPKWLHMYDDFITKNAGQVSQIESALRSLTYIVPGRFRDAEIASESIHSGVQLLSLYHDTLLLRVLCLSKLPLPSLARIPSPRNRYTQFWTTKSALYRRVAYVLQIVQYTELLCEMAAKRRGERVRWRVVVMLEALKAICRLLLLRITRSRPIITPALPERVAVPETGSGDEDGNSALAELMGEDKEEEDLREEDGLDGWNSRVPGPNELSSLRTQPYSHTQEWPMPRTGMTLPSLPAAGDISTYLLSRVLTADDIKPATKLLHQLHGPSSHAAEILHILAPVAYAVSLATARNKKSWYPWVLGVSLELAARQLREKGLRTTPLERDEWSRRGWAMGWWAMRGAAYNGAMKALVEKVRTKVPGIVGGILEDYEYLWENYYFSTSA